MTLPRLFIGSSTEGLDVAYALQENLEFDAEVTVWSQGFFEPSTATLSALLQKLGKFDFAIVVFSPDDVLRLRGHEFRTARDNVLFELGLFYGRLGAERCFFAVPRGIVDFHLPTDLLGIAPLTYSVARSDGNLVAALATAANQVRRTLRKIAQSPPPVPGTKPLTASNLRSPRTSYPLGMALNWPVPATKFVKCRWENLVLSAMLSPKCLRS